MFASAFRHAGWSGLLGLVALLGFRAACGEGETQKSDESFDKEPRLKYEDNGRRDPFTFMKPLAAPIPETETTKPTEMDIINRVTKEAEGFYAQAERAIKSSKSPEAAALCDKGLEALKDVQGEVPEVQLQRERLFRLKKAAERLKARADAEQSFRNMGVKVTGVMALERDSLAIVNSKVVGKGELIETADTNELPPRVEDILPGRVIFNFRGYKIELRISQ